VTHGRWKDVYTDETITDVTDATIDHAVSLRWAWDNGASGWAKAKRIEFGNDPVNLVVTTRATNSAKGAAGPGEWVPEDLHSAKELRARQARIVKKYGLGKERK
jgi:hypothetical protein